VEYRCANQPSGRGAPKDDAQAVAWFRKAAEQGANARAWDWGRRQLEQAIAQGTHYAFKTTLGARDRGRALLRDAET
jgi:TPR repeat protein